MKKITAVLTALSLLMLTAVFSVTAQSTYKYGDINKDDIVSISDATDIQLCLAGYLTIDQSSMKLADVDGDGSLSIMDATCVQMYLARLIDKFPAEDIVVSTTPPTDSDGYYDQVVKP